MNLSSPTPAKGELPPNRILASATAEAISAERKAMSAQSDTADRELDEMTFGGDWAQELVRERLA